MWENKGHRPYWAFLHIQALSTPFENLTGFLYQKQLFLINEHAVNSAYLDTTEMKFATAYFEKFWKDKEKRNQFLNAVQNYFRQAEKIVTEFSTLDLKKLSEQEILSQMEKAVNVHGFSFLLVTNPQHVAPLEMELNALLEKKENKEKILSSITRNNLPLPFDEEHQEIKNYRKIWTTISFNQQQKILQTLTQKYGWIGGIEGETPYGNEHYEREILSTQEKREEIPLIKMETEILELGNLIALLSNQRIWSRWHGMRLRYCIKLGVQELATRWNFPLIEYATIPEMQEYSHTKKINFQELEKRKKEGYVATIINGKPILLTGEKAAIYTELVEEQIEHTDSVQGRCANPGKIIGKVRIISFASEEYHKEISEFQNGEILVTGMTRPQIAHLCHKASAIITDEGGITSHASIISREFNIPCIIATKNATKIFKTGDIIEVDAITGIARKINK